MCLNCLQKIMGPKKSRPSNLFDWFVWLKRFRLAIFKIEMTVCHLYESAWCGVVSFEFQLTVNGELCVLDGFGLFSNGFIPIFLAQNSNN